MCTGSSRIHNISVFTCAQATKTTTTVARCAADARARAQQARNSALALQSQGYRHAAIIVHMMIYEVVLAHATLKTLKMAEKTRGRARIKNSNSN